MAITPDISVEIDRPTRAYLIRIRRYLREPYDQPKVALSLKTRTIKVEGIKVLLYRCSAWNLYKEHYYSKLRTVHRRSNLASQHPGTA